MRKIAENAETTTTAIYVRYAGKQELFMALVEEPASGLVQLLRKGLEEIYSFTADCVRNFQKEHYRRNIPIMLDYIYCHFEAFKLLVMCDKKNLFRRYTYNLALLELEYTQKVADEAWEQKKIPDEFLLLIIQSSYSGLFELVIHDIPKDDAKNIIKPLIQWHMASWDVFMG